MNPLCLRLFVPLIIRLAIVAVAMIATGVTLGAVTAQTQEPPQTPLALLPITGDDFNFDEAVFSPEGRWVVVVGEDEGNTTSLWIAPSAGGDPVRLTDAGYMDLWPAWAPSGDRLYFVSNRPGRGQGGRYVMSIGIDPSTGRPTDVPRQITLEADSFNPVPSPDGRTILYGNGRELRVTPAQGGNSRLVATLAHPLSTDYRARTYDWDPDGTAIYFNG